MKTEKTKISTGVGFHTAPHRNYAMLRDDTFDFLEMWSANSELFQDLKNKVKSIFASYGSWTRRPRRLATQMRVFDAHKCMEVVVYSMSNTTVPSLSVSTCGKFYVSITDDGFISDILENRPNMNAGNFRTVVSYKP